MLIILLISYAPLHKIRIALQSFNDWDFPFLIGLSVAYYGLKVVRFWYLMQSIGIHKPFKLVLVSYLSSQPISLIPGGEIYRSHALKRYTGVPVKKSVAQFTLQGFLEALSLTGIAVVSAVVIGSFRIPFIVLAILLAIGVLAIRDGHVATISAQLNRLPFMEMGGSTIEQFSKKHQEALSRRWLPLLFGLSLAADLVGVVIAYVAVTGVGGQISVFQAGLLYVIPIVVGFLSFLPGGLGVSEQSAVGVLLLSDVSVGQAVAATLIMRVAIVGSGVFYGVLAQLAGRVYESKTAANVIYDTN